MTKRIMAVAIVSVAVCLLAALTPGLWAHPPGGTDAVRSLSELQPAETARQAMRGDRVLPGKRTDAPPTAPARGGLIWFTNPADFEVFNVRQGNVLKGIENFEASVLRPNMVDGFDDPLDFGIPNQPDGFPYPNGMDGWPNLRVQSNNLGGNPTVPSPVGTNGLAAASAGFQGSVSDVVVSNTFVNSLDLLFFYDGNPPQTAVGFNTIDFVGPQIGVEVRVYDDNNNFLGEMPSPAEPTGANFIGVWSDIPIGRINIFSLGAESGDNIQVWEGGPPPPTGACCFDDGTCSMETEADCVRSGGKYQGDGTVCKPNPCPQPQPCPWDFDDNGDVGISDLLVLLANWGPCP